MMSYITMLLQRATRALVVTGLALGACQRRHKMPLSLWLRLSKVVLR